MKKRDEPVVTTIRIAPLVWELLRAFAAARALRVGGRPSVSRIVAELAEAERDRRESTQEAQAAR